MSDKSVLIVDDTKENLDILVELLSSHYSVKAAPNGTVALKIAEKTHPDLILLDVIMPGLDGYEVCAQLKNKEETSSIPIVFVTSNENPDEVKKGMDLGALGYLLKPVDPEKLLRTCKEALGE